MIAVQNAGVPAVSICGNNGTKGAVMKFGVTHKLFIAILTAAGLSVVSSSLIMQWSLNRGFLEFVNSMEKSGISRLAAKLEQTYRTERNWEFLRRDPNYWHRLITVSLPEEALPPTEGMPAPTPGDRELSKSKNAPPRQIHHFYQRLFLLDADNKVLMSQVEIPADNSVTPIVFQGRAVGYLGLLPRTDVSDAPQKRFLQNQNQVFALQAVFIAILAAALSLLLAKRLVRPLSELTRATNQLAAGSFNVRVPVLAHDELGQLAGDFNSLAATLEKSALARRQWVADISHELRTPIAILRGEIEALQDGIRQPSPDTIHSLHSEILRLGRLVDDLYQLSLSDVGALTYNRQMLDIAELLAETIEAQQHAFVTKEISITAYLPEKGKALKIVGDPERLHQLFSNLLENSLKYTDRGGQLQISMRGDGAQVVIDFEDSSPGAPEEALSHLFDRLYRVESSRNRSTGGAGLGLAICSNIVQAHEGNIKAQRSSLGGVWIRLELPGAGS